MFKRRLEKLRHNLAAGGSMRMIAADRDGEGNQNGNKGRNGRLTNMNNNIISRTNGELSNFDACVEACDALAASSASFHFTEKRRKDSVDRNADENDVDRSRNALPLSEEGGFFALSDCFVRVSPDGDLLIDPISSQSPQSSNEIKATKENNNIYMKENQTENSENSTSNEDINEKEIDDCPNDSNITTSDENEINNDDNESREVDNSFSLSHVSPDDFQSSIIVGNDAQGGDCAMNGFSAVGWNHDAATLALRECTEALKATANFTEQVVIARKFEAEKTRGASNSIHQALENNIFNHHNYNEGALTSRVVKSIQTNSKQLRGLISSNASSSGGFAHDSMSVIGGPTADIDSGSNKVGLGFKESFPSLNSALVSLESYYSTVSENDAKRWQEASKVITPQPHHHFTNSPNVNRKNYSPAIGTACLHKIAEASQKSANRASKRERVLFRAYKLREDAEKRLAYLKVQAKHRWKAVHEAERLSKQRMNATIHEMMQERARARERRRTMMQQEEESKNLGERGTNNSNSFDDSTEGNGPNQATQEEIWELVSQVTESFEHGSFAPTGFPSPNLKKEANPEPKEIEFEDPDNEPALIQLTPEERAQIESQYNLPRLRGLAKLANEAVEDAVGALLNALSNVDTTYRSSRIATEATLLSAANSQAECLNSLVSLEKASLMERLESIKELEKKIDEIDVRSDLGNFMDSEKRKPESRSIMGLDDDGGLASALAVLNCHEDSNVDIVTIASETQNVVLEGWGEEESGVVSREEIEEMTNYFFEDHSNIKASQSGDAPPDELDSIVAFLIDAVQAEKKTTSRIHRAMVCHSLNKQRSIQTEIKTEEKFDGLCKVLDALLTGCEREANDIGSAKICMMLAQTFYKVDLSSENQNDRSNRVFVKSKLINHPIWSDEHFW